MRALVGASLMLSVLSCTSGRRDIKTPSTSLADDFATKVVRPAAGESVVFGSIDATDHMWALAASSGNVDVLRRNNDAAVVLTSRTGDFVWNLPPGRYVIQRYHERVTLLGKVRKSWFDIGAGFDVPPGPGVLYIGHLDIGSIEGGHTRNEILDDYEETLARLGGRIPDGLAGPEKHLMFWPSSSRE